MNIFGVCIIVEASLVFISAKKSGITFSVNAASFNFSHRLAGEFFKANYTPSLCYYI
jgi:hypothetical protein